MVTVAKNNMPLILIDRCSLKEQSHEAYNLQSLTFILKIVKGKSLQNIRYIQITVEKCAVQSTGLGFFVTGLRKINSLYVCNSLYVAIPLSTLTVKFSWLFFFKL